MQKVEVSEGYLILGDNHYELSCMQVMQQELRELMENVLQQEPE